MRIIHLLNNPHDKKSQDFCETHGQKYPVVNWYTDENMMQQHLIDYPSFRSLPCVLVQHDTYVVTVMNGDIIETTFAVPSGYCYLEPTDYTDEAIVQRLNDISNWETRGKTVNV